MLIRGNRHKGRDLEPGRFELRQDTCVNVVDRHHSRGHIGIVRFLYANDLAQRFNGGYQTGAGGYFQFFHCANSQTVKDEVVPRGTVMG